MSVQNVDGVSDHRPNLLHHFQATIVSLLVIDSADLIIIFQPEIVVLQKFVQPFSKAHFVKRLRKTYTASGNLVLIGRTNATPGCA